MKTIKNLIDVEKGKSALVIGAGATIKEYEKQITEFINVTNCITIGINNMTAFWTPDYHLWTDTQRFRTYGKHILPDSKLLLDSSFSLKLINEIIGNKEYTALNRKDRVGIPIDYRDGIIYGYFRTAGCLSIMLLHLMGVDEINVVGMDGYSLHDHKDVVAGKQSQHCYGIGITDTASWQTGVAKDKIIKNSLINIENYGIEFKILTPTKYRRFYDNTRLHL